MKKIKVWKKAASTGRFLKNKFNHDVKNLKAQCEALGLKLYSWEENPPEYFICVLSSHDMEIGSRVADCSDVNEAYFLNEIDYEYYNEQLGA